MATTAIAATAITRFFITTPTLFKPASLSSVRSTNSSNGRFSGRRHGCRALPPRNLVSALCTDHDHRSTAFLVIAFSLPAMVTIALTTSGGKSSVAVVPFAKLTFGPLR